jgi:hypothetical protein
MERIYLMSVYSLQSPFSGGDGRTSIVAPRHAVSVVHELVTMPKTGRLQILHNRSRAQSAPAWFVPHPTPARSIEAR